MEMRDEAIGPSGARSAMGRLGQVMVEAMQHWCPDVPIKVSSAMARRWYKGAKAVYQSGIMVPTRPEGGIWVADLYLWTRVSSWLGSPSSTTPS